MRYSTVVVLFAFGLASKPMIITLPFALLLLDYWPLAHLPIPEDSENTSLFFKKLWPLVLEKIPLFLLSARSAYVTVLAQAQSNAIAVKGILTFPVRLANALWSYLLYILKGLGLRA